MSLSYSHDHLGSVWYHSEPSEGPYSPNYFLLFLTAAKWVQLKNSPSKMVSINCSFPRNDASFIRLEQDGKAQRAPSSVDPNTIRLHGFGALFSFALQYIYFICCYIFPPFLYFGLSFTLGLSKQSLQYIKVIQFNGGCNNFLITFSLQVCVYSLSLTW